MNFDEMTKLAEQLENYAWYDGSELGEACRYLINGVRLISYVSDEFYQALGKEIELQLENFKQNSRIVEKKEVTTQTHKELEWKGIDY